jgi:hypothetical protein
MVDLKKERQKGTDVKQILKRKEKDDLWADWTVVWSEKKSALETVDHSVGQTAWKTADSTVENSVDSKAVQTVDRKAD